MIITSGDISAFLDQDDLPLAESHLVTMAALVKGWTRGNGFTSSSPLDVEDDLGAVIITACARLVSNPAQFRREEIAGYSAVGGFDGFTIPEQMILNRYRKRSHDHPSASSSTTRRTVTADRYLPGDQRSWKRL